MQQAVWRCAGHAGGSSNANTVRSLHQRSDEFTGSVEGGQFIVEAEIEPISNTAIGLSLRGSL